MKQSASDAKTREGRTSSVRPSLCVVLGSALASRSTQYLPSSSRATSSRMSLITALMRIISDSRSSL